MFAECPCAEQQAKSLLDEGRMTELEMEQIMINQFQVGRLFCCMHPAMHYFFTAYTHGINTQMSVW
jgi:hypothetical protein